MTLFNLIDSIPLYTFSDCYFVSLSRGYTCALHQFSSFNFIRMKGKPGIGRTCRQTKHSLGMACLQLRCFIPMRIIMVTYLQIISSKAKCTGQIERPLQTCLFSQCLFVSFMHPTWWNLGVKINLNLAPLSESWCWQ